MADNTGIEWADATWTPVKAQVKKDAARIAEAKGYVSLVQIAEKMAGHVGCHCEKVSDGCGHCYSETFQSRCLPYNGTGLPFDRRSRDLVDIFLDEQELLKPLRWKRTRKIFVCSQTDWCADFVPDEMRDRMLAVAALCPQHEFLFLTKRAERCAKYFSLPIERGRRVHLGWDGVLEPPGWSALVWTHSASWPLPNVLLGFSAENQECFDVRWSHMRKLAAAGWKIWVSIEPMLGPISVAHISDEGLECECGWYGVETQAIEDGNEEDPGFLCPQCREECAHAPLDERLSHAVVGGESGPGARPLDIQWIRNLISQCRAADTPCFVKQFGAQPMYEREVGTAKGGCPVHLKLKDRKGGKPLEWPEDLRVREYPK